MGRPSERHSQFSRTSGTPGSTPPRPPVEDWGRHGVLARRTALWGSSRLPRRTGAPAIPSGSQMRITTRARLHIGVGARSGRWLR